MIIKPMLASSCTDLGKLRFPVLTTPKLDGIRCLVIDGKAVSRKFKEIPNRHIQKLVSTLPNGFDGELMLQDHKASFQQVTSAVMSEEGNPAFVYHVFDYVSNNCLVSYTERVKELIKVKTPTDRDWETC